MEKAITGMMIYYYIVCKRKLWLFAGKGITMEDQNADVALGQIIDESFYNREDKHINIDNIINIDFIKDNIVHEVKKSRKIEEASVLQVKYYMYYLKKRGVNGFSAIINYPETRETLTVELTDSDEKMIEEICDDIRKIISSDISPVCENTKICKKCAYYEYCYI